MASSLQPRSKPHSDDAAVRVMLIDDSIVVRSITERIIETAGGFEIVASLAGAPEALAWLDHGSVDVIVLDLEMPGMNGLDALPQLLAKAGNARVIILSANCDEGGPAAIKALALGAADTLLKPGRGSFAGTFGETLISRIRAIADGNHPPRPALPSNAEHIVEPAPSLPRRPLSAIAVGASTGGIVAIIALLMALPRRLSCPIFVTQHLPGGFISFFADQLGRETGRDVHVGEDGMRVAGGAVYLAPGQAHMRLSLLSGHPHIMLDHAPSPVGACPAVDPMMASVAAIYGSGACAVMLSGMGRDGLEGVRDVRRLGGLVLAQDAASSVVWGMPGAVAREGLAEAVLEPSALGALIARTMEARP